MINRCPADVKINTDVDYYRFVLGCGRGSTVLVVPW